MNFATAILSNPRPQIVFRKPNYMEMWRNLTTSVVEKSFNDLLSFYTISDELDVKKFLGNHLAVVPHLIDAKSKIKEYFENCTLGLSFFYDNDDNYDEASAGLVVHIITSDSPDLAFDNLKKFQEEWLFAINDKEISHLDFVLDYI